MLCSTHFSAKQSWLLVHVCIEQHLDISYIKCNSCVCLHALMKGQSRWHHQAQAGTVCWPNTWVMNLDWLCSNENVLFHWSCASERCYDVWLDMGEELNLFSHITSHPECNNKCFHLHNYPTYSFRKSTHTVGHLRLHLYTGCQKSKVQRPNQVTLLTKKLPLHYEGFYTWCYNNVKCLPHERPPRCELRIGRVSESNRCYTVRKGLWEGLL